MYPLLRRLLFYLPPETAHKLALCSLQLVAHVWQMPRLSLATKVMGLDFPNPVGIAAGLDKNAEYLLALASLGVGFVEVGSMTLQPREGNAKPRLFRLPAQQALINRIGLANQGIEAILERLEQADFPGVLGVNLAKEAHQQDPLLMLQDYQNALQQVYPYADYITINLSCPHEPGLRELHFGQQLEQLLAGLKEQQILLSQQYDRYVPLVIKLSPELNATEIAMIAEQLLIYRVDGVVVSNTSNQRPLVQGLKHAEESGGLSGKPLFISSTQTLRELYSHLGRKIPIIGVGGIMSATDAAEKMQAGAKLVQIYSGLIYRGPRLIREIIMQQQGEVQ